MDTGQFDMDLSKVVLDRTHPPDELIDLAFKTIQAPTHLSQESQNKVVGLISHRATKIGRLR